jgi:hypothetical protein
MPLALGKDAPLGRAADDRRSILYSVEEDCNGSQLHPGEEISRKLVVTCDDGAEVLEQIEEALDQIAFTIECEVALPLDVSVDLGRNDRADSTMGPRWVRVSTNGSAS